MSVQAMGWVLDHSTTKLAERLVMIAVANDLDKHGRNGWTSHARIAEEANTDERTVRRALDAARTKGEIDWYEIGTRVKKGRARRLYWFPAMVAEHGLDPWDEETAERFGLTPDDMSTVVSGRHRTNPQPTPDKSAADTGHPVRPLKEDPSGNPSEDPSSSSSKPKKPRKRNPIWDALVVVHGEPTTKAETSRIGKAAAEHAKIGSTPEQIIDRSREAWRRWGGQPFGPEAVLKWWGSLATPAPPRQSNGRGTINEAFDEIERRLARDAGRVASDRGTAVRSLPATGHDG